MAQEDKELLLKDLSARLLYGVKVQINSEVKKVVGVKNGFVVTKERGLFSTIEYITRIECCKPYLRPMSSMTEEERKELKALCEEDLSEFANFIRAGHGLSHDGLYMFDKMRQLEWLLKNHFDYRGLIEKGLALEVTNENNPYKL